MHFFYLADNRVCRTGSRTERTSLTLIRIDLVLKKIFADSCRTFLIYDVGDIFILKYRRVDSTGLGAVCPSAQREFSFRW